MTRTAKDDTMYGMNLRRCAGVTITISMNNVDSVVANSAVELRDSRTQTNDSTMKGTAAHHFCSLLSQACSQRMAPMLDSMPN